MMMATLATACLWLFTAAAAVPHARPPATGASAPATSGPAVQLEVSGPRSLTVSDLAEEAGVYYGKVVRVRSQVSRGFGPHAFLLNDEPLLAAPNVLVLVPEPLSAAALDYIMTVVGIPRPFNRRELEREYPWFKRDLFRDTGLWPVWERYGVPVVIAQSIRTELGLELVRTAKRYCRGKLQTTNSQYLIPDEAQSAA